MNKKYQVSFVVMMIMLFSLVLFYQNCSKKGNLDLSGNSPCTVNCGNTGQNQVTIVLLKNGVVATSFSTTDTITIQAYNVGSTPIGCVAVHLFTATTDINQDLASCDMVAPANPPSSPWGYMNSPWTNMGAYWQYSRPVSELFPPGYFKACGYNSSTGSKGCSTVFTVN